MKVTRVPSGRPLRTTSGTRTTGWETLLYSLQQRVKRVCVEYAQEWRRMEAWWDHFPLCPFKRGAVVAKVSFHNNTIGNFMVYQDRLEINLSAIWAPGKFRMSVYNFGNYFYGQHCWWTETNIFGKDFCVFFNFHCPQLFYCSPCPTAAPASLNMHVVSTNFAKTLICKREYDVILWRHKQRISNNNDHYTPLLNTRIWKGASNQAVAQGITRPLYVTALKQN